MADDLSLYDQALALDSALQRMETGEDDAELACALADAQREAGALLQKVDRFAEYMSDLESTAGWAEAEITRLYIRQRNAQKRLQWMKDYAIGVMQQHGWKSMEGNLNTLTLHNNPPSVAITDKDAIPPQYLVSKTVIDPDKNAIKAAIRAGREVPGAELKQTVGLRRS